MLWLGQNFCSQNASFSHDCISEGEKVCVSFLCVYGRSKLWYQVRPKLNQLPTVMADLPI